MRTVVQFVTAVALVVSGAIWAPAIRSLDPVVGAQTGTPMPITTIPNRRYNQGQSTFGPVAVPLGLTHIEVSATRASWPDVGGDIIAMTVQLSLDGGNTWMDWVGFTAPGGDLRKSDGSIRPTSVVATDLPDPTNTRRQIRGVIDVQRALDTAITVNVQ